MAQLKAVFIHLMALKVRQDLLLKFLIEKGLISDNESKKAFAVDHEELRREAELQWQELLSSVNVIASQTEPR